MRRLIPLLLLLTSTMSLAKKDKDPAIESRKQFVTAYTMVLEQAGGMPQMLLMLSGKNKDIFELWMPNTPVDYMISFEKERVEPIKSELKKIGFRMIEIKTDIFSATFPKGVWDIPVDTPEATH